MLLHLNPFSSQIHIYELDPGYTERLPSVIAVASNSLTQLQVVDNLVVVHNLDEQSSQLYDLKLTDY